jgi:hypothetical protein
MTGLIEMKTADITGEALNWSVAKALGLSVYLAEPHYMNAHRVMVRFTPDGCHFEQEKRFQPSTDWAQGGPLLDSNQIFLDPPHDMHRANYDEKTGKVKGCWETYESWHATVSARVRTLPPKVEGFPGRVGRGEGSTPLIAACRAIVASVLGDTVSVPKELCHD